MDLSNTPTTAPNEEPDASSQIFQNENHQNTKKEDKKMELLMTMKHQQRKEKGEPKQTGSLSKAHFLLTFHVHLVLLIVFIILFNSWFHINLFIAITMNPNFQIITLSFLVQTSHPNLVNNVIKFCHQ